MCLEVRQQPGESLTSSVVSFLRHKHVLLMLDNFEHVIDAARSPTPSHTPARTCRCLPRAERRWRSTVSCCGRRARSGSPTNTHRPTTLPRLRRCVCSPIAARAVRPDLVMDEASGLVVADICRQLDGVPLAIELAAARVVSLFLGQRDFAATRSAISPVDGRPTHRARTSPDASGHGRLVLRAARGGRSTSIQSSRRLCRGFTLDAAEAVVSGDGIDERERARCPFRSSRVLDDHRRRI